MVAPFELPRRNAVTFPIVRQEPPDPDITCLVCHDSRPCEWAIEVVCHGTRQYIGIHERCIAALERRAK